MPYDDFEVISVALTEAKQKAAAKAFAKYWEGKGYEKGESQKFWLSVLRDVFGVAEPEKFITFEDQVKLDSSTGWLYRRIYCRDKGHD